MWILWIKQNNLNFNETNYEKQVKVRKLNNKFKKERKIKFNEFFIKDLDLGLNPDLFQVESRQKSSGTATLPDGTGIFWQQRNFYVYCKSFNNKIFLHLWKLILIVVLFFPQKGFTFLNGDLGLEPEAKLNIFGSLSLLAAFITNCNAGLMFISGVWQTCTGTVFLLLIC